jgi:acyl carrier protein
MRESEIRAAVLRGVGRIAPEVELDAIDPGAGLREQMDLDSMDFLNLVVGLGKELGVEVPESDYARLATLDSCVAYLAARTGETTAPG